MQNPIDINKEKILILFDGVCNLCNSSVLYVIKHDKANRFIFAPLQGDAGQRIISEFNIDAKKTDSIITYDPRSHTVKLKSSAALKIASNMKFPFPLLGLFYVVPPVMRNLVYDFIARKRYKWFGKKDACMIPTLELKAKFLE